LNTATGRVKSAFFFPYGDIKFLSGQNSYSLWRFRSGGTDVHQTTPPRNSICEQKDEIINLSAVTQSISYKWIGKFFSRTMKPDRYFHDVGIISRLEENS
jgi:hypothetical protein